MGGFSTLPPFPGGSHQPPGSTQENGTACALSMSLCSLGTSACIHLQPLGVKHGGKSPGHTHTDSHNMHAEVCTDIHSHPHNTCSHNMHAAMFIHTHMHFVHTCTQYALKCAHLQMQSLWLNFIDSNNEAQEDSSSTF